MDPCILHVGIAQLQNFAVPPKSLMCIIMIPIPSYPYPASCLMAVIKATIIVNQPLWGTVLIADCVMLLPSQPSNPLRIQAGFTAGSEMNISEYFRIFLNQSQGS
jgi:hypothetical protein